MAYTKTNWSNNMNPPINADNLNKIETELETLDNATEDLEENKINKPVELLASPISSATTNALTESKDNYEYLEIYYNALDNEGHNISSSVKIKVETGKQTTVLPVGWWYSASPATQGFQFQGIAIENGRDITYGYVNRLLVATNNVTTTTSNTTVTITSILGYNYN